MIALAALGCAPVLVAQDEVFRVTARKNETGTTLVLALTGGWHLNREYPFAWAPATSPAPSSPFVFDADHRGHQVVEGVAHGIWYVSFCNPDRCRIEAVPVHLARAPAR